MRDRVEHLGSPYFGGLVGESDAIVHRARAFSGYRYVDTHGARLGEGACVCGVGGASWRATRIMAYHRNRSSRYDTCSPGLTSCFQDEKRRGRSRGWLTRFLCGYGRLRSRCVGAARLKRRTLWSRSQAISPRTAVVQSATARVSVSSRVTDSVECWSIWARGRLPSRRISMPTAVTRPPTQKGKAALCSPSLPAR